VLFVGLIPFAHRDREAFQEAGPERRGHLQRRRPFGGVKQSGLGREGGLEGIEEYLYTQYIGIADPYAG
jgi:hypothetical protein